MQRLENRGTTSGSHRQALLGEKWLTTSASQEPGLPLGISAGRAAAWCIHIHPHLPVQYSGLRALVFPLEAQQLQHGERGVGSHGAGCWLTHHALADEAATRLFAARLCPKQNLAFQVAAAALAKTTFFFSTVQTITGPYQLLSKIKHSPGAVHYAGSRARKIFK